MVLREVEYLSENRKTSEIAHYVASVSNVFEFSNSSRNHWGVEGFHWSLDVVFKDDQNQTKQTIAAQNFATVRRMVFNTLQQETKIKPKFSKPKKRMLASIDEEYRDQLIRMRF